MRGREKCKVKGEVRKCVYYLGEYIRKTTRVKRRGDRIVVRSDEDEAQGNESWKIASLMREEVERNYTRRRKGDKHE